MHYTHMKHNKEGSEDKTDGLGFKKGACVLAPVAFWANYPDPCLKYDRIQDQGKLDVPALIFGVSETKKKRCGVPGFLIGLVFYLSS